MCVIIWRYMRPRYLIAFPLVILAFCFSEAKCAAQSDMIWRVGGQYGVVGITSCGDKTEDFTMSLTLGFDMAVKDTPWRWGIEGERMNRTILFAPTLSMPALLRSTASMCGNNRCSAGQD